MDSEDHTGRWILLTGRFAPPGHEYTLGMSSYAPKAYDATEVAHEGTSFRLFQAWFESKNGNPEESKKLCQQSPRGALRIWREEFENSMPKHGLKICLNNLRFILKVGSKHAQKKSQNLGPA